MTTFIQFQMRRDTTANWTSANPVLGQGELGLDTTLNRFKIGDGATAYNTLGYAPNTVFAGTGVPSAGLGVNGDIYFDKTVGAVQFYGPKAAGSWGSGVTLTGATGAPGSTGPTGPGVPVSPAGTTGQGLFKNSATALDDSWANTPVDGTTITITGNNVAGVPNAGLANNKIVNASANSLKGEFTGSAAAQQDLSMGASTFPARAAAGNLSAKAIADLGITWVGLSTVAAQTAALNAATVLLQGMMSAIDKKKLNAGWTDLVNELGADPTGNVDATAIITAWLGTITTGVLFLPAGCRVRVDGPVAWNKEANFIGGERRTSIISCGNATNTIFTVSSDGVTFENMRFSAGAAGADNAALRTAGFAVTFDSSSDSSGIRKCDILFQWSGVNSQSSLQYMEDLNIREYGNNAPNGQCLLINGVGDRYVRRITTDNGSNPTGFAGIRVQACASLVISDCNIIHAGNALELSPGAGVTVPSIEAVNCFFDTSVNGLAVIPTSTGVVARSKFTNCWFGTHTTNGILLSNPGGASSSYEGLQFVNCDIYGCPTGINASAGGGKWEFQGTIAGCTTQAVLLGPSASHFPNIHNSVIGPHGIFGANALGINVTAGTYKGLTIRGNNVVNNTGAALTLGAVTVAAGEAGFFRITDNAGINPRGAVTTPAVPATTVVATNITGFRVNVMLKAGTTAPTVLTINGVASVLPVVSQLIPIVLDPGGTIQMTFTVAPTWTWIAN